MATAKAASKAVAKKTDDAIKEPTHTDGIYTEYGVKLSNGMAVDVEVITDRRKLPASWGSLVAEGNAPALVMASMTVKTRRTLDLSGATLEDVETVLADVISRAQDAAAE